MEYIQRKPRSQIVFIESSLEEKIEPDNPVRIIDAFVDSCKLEEFGFTHAKHAPEGRPPYNLGDRQWGFDYTLMIGKKKVDGEVGLIFIAYLFKRMMNIIGVNGLMEAIDRLFSLYTRSKLVIKRLLIDF